MGKTLGKTRSFMSNLLCLYWQLIADSSELIVEDPKPPKTCQETLKPWKSPQLIPQQLLTVNQKPAHEFYATN